MRRPAWIDDGTRPPSSTELRLRRAKDTQSTSTMQHGTAHSGACSCVPWWVNLSISSFPFAHCATRSACYKFKCARLSQSFPSNPHCLSTQASPLSCFCHPSSTSLCLHYVVITHTSSFSIVCPKLRELLVLFITDPCQPRTAFAVPALPLPECSRKPQL